MIHIRVLLAALCAMAGLSILLADSVNAASTPSARSVYDQVFKPATITCPDNGVGASAAACTLAFNGSSVSYTCSDADGCDVTLSEISAEDGRHVQIVNVSANAANFADTAGVSELAGAAALGQYDSLTVLYTADRWVELHRSNN